ncbi:MAG: FAD:protein FMN transferase [Planctomycetes bacterium]|nr:FAD:protein FMN transferase [Planctomycetota bacterium]
MRPSFRPPPAVVAVWLAGLAACGGPPRVQQFGGPTMGSSYEVKFVGAAPLASVRAAVEHELARFDLAFSQWREDSEIARCNLHASTAPFPVSPLFAEVLDLSLRLAAATGGAFDPTVKPLSDRYRAAKREPGRPLDPAALAALRAHVGHGLVEVRDGAVHKRRAEVQIDLDGIVAGACADAIAARLHALGVHDFFLQITGEVLAHGEKAPGVPWVAGIVDPAADLAGGEAAIRSLPLRDLSLCTSGDYRNAVRVGDEIVHHVFDPRTGANARHRVVSVSVLAPSAAVADAVGTALLVAGDEAAAAVWPALQGFGVVGALFLVGDAAGGLRPVGLSWPE